MNKIKDKQKSQSNQKSKSKDFVGIKMLPCLAPVKMKIDYHIYHHNYLFGIRCKNAQNQIGHIFHKRFFVSSGFSTNTTRPS